MAIDRFLLKSLTPKLMAKALQTFDRATMIVVGSCWAAAVLMMIFAVYTLRLSSIAHRDAATALAVEPSIPVINRNPIEKNAAQVILDRLKHRYPDLSFAMANGQSIRITSVDGSKFRQWLMALSYIEVIAPDYQWLLTEYCVGKCKNNLMNATIQADRVTFTAPDKDK